MSVTLQRLQSIRRPLAKTSQSDHWPGQSHCIRTCLSLDRGPRREHVTPENQRVGKQDVLQIPLPLTHRSRDFLFKNAPNLIALMMGKMEEIYQEGSDFSGREIILGKP